jgi:GrpB-like predicted nucleotidyltransferase (UPF0157 family)
MTPEELGRLFPIYLSPADPAWPRYFNRERKRIEMVLENRLIYRMEHIGSTAIPRLMAKPSIDMLLEVHPSADAKIIIKQMNEMGYHFIPRPENPPPHMMFVKGYTLKGIIGQPYHVHVRYPGDWDEIHFRDYLIAHPEAAAEYEQLKIELSKRFKNDREGYTEAKTGFIQKIIQCARNSRVNRPGSSEKW